MPAFGRYPVADAQDPGEEISSGNEGRVIGITESDIVHPSHTDGFVDIGDPVVIGANIVGVALIDADVDTKVISVDTEGIFNLDVVASNDAGDSAVAGGDLIFINRTTAVLSKIRDASTNIPFGYALGIVASGLTEAIAVKVHFDPAETWLMDVQKLYFGDGKDASITWNETFLAVAISAASKALGIGIAIAASALADGYGFIEKNLNVGGVSTGFTAAESVWLNLGATYEVLAGGGLITPHTDGIYQPVEASITGATIALAGKFTDQMAGADFGLYTIWNFNLTQTIDAMMEINNPALMGYTAGAHSSAVVGSIPFFSTGGGAIKYIRLHGDAS